MEIIRIRVQMNGEKTALTSLKQIDAKIDEINKKKVSVNINTKDAANAKNAVNDLGTAAGNTAKQSKILGDTLSMIKFTAIAAAIGGVTTALHSALSEMKAVDTQLTNIQKVSNMTSAELDRLGDKAYSTASKYGVAADEYLSAVYTFQKAGLGDAADQLGELATKTMLVGDTSADVASKFLIATNAAWNMQGSMSALSTVVDEADYINNNYATSLDKLAAAMPIVASTSANLGMSVEETMAVIGTITSITQETGTKAATAWRALAMNITGELGSIVDETGETIEVTTQSVESMSDALKIYGNDAVKAAQESGQLIDPMQAVISLSQAYKDGLLNDIELENILMNVGGKLRTNQLTALVKDLASDTSIYYDIMSKLPKAAGTADAEIGVMLSSWESKTKILSNTWTDFVQKSLSSDSIKGLLDTATNLLDVMDNLGLAAKAVGGILVFAFGRQITSGVSSLVNNVTNLVTGLRSGATAATMFQSALGWIGLATAAIAGITMAVREYREEQVEAANAAKDAANKRAEELQSQGDKLEDLIYKYRTLAEGGFTQDELAQVQNIQDAINGLLGDQYEKVDLVNGAYEVQNGILNRNLALVREQTQAELDAARNAAERALLASVPTTIFGGKMAWGEAYDLDPTLFGSRNSFKKVYETDGYGTHLSEVGINWDKTAEGIVKNYDDISEAIRNFEEAFTSEELVGKGMPGRAFKWLTDMQSEMRDSVEAYKAAVEAANGDTQKIADAGQALTETMSGIGGSSVDAANDVESSVRRIDAAMQQLRDVMNGPQRSDDFDNYVEALRIFRDEVDAGRVNSNAFWSSAEFLLGADVVGQYADNAAGLVQLVEDSQLDEVFGEITDAEGKAVTGVQNFVDALLAAADESGRVAGGAAKITGEPGDYKIAIKNVQALADAWGLPVEAIYTAMEALSDYGEFDLSDSALTDYLEWLGVTFDELGKTDFTSVVNTLSGLGFPAQDITTIVQQLQNMNAIDMGGVAGTLEDVNTALGKVSSTAQEASDEIANLNGQTTGDVTNHIYTLSGALSGATAAADATRSAINRLNGTKATTTITTRNITENLVSYSYSGTGVPYNTNTSSGSFIDALKNAGLKGIGFAKGTNSAQGGIALVGDERSPDGSPRPELINDNGRMYLAGQFGPEIVRLGRGAQVYTASETRQIMAGGIPAYARGTQSTSNAAGNSLISKIVGTAKSITDSGTGTKSTTTTTTKYYTISFNANGGSGGPSPITGKSGSKGTIPYSRPSRSGYTFQGWASSSGSYTVAYKSGASITFYSNKTLYAVWKKNQTTNSTPSTTPTTSATSIISDKISSATQNVVNALFGTDYSGSYSGPTSYTTTTSSGGGGGGGGYTTYGGGGGGGGGGSSSSSSSSAEDDALVALKRKADEDLQNREFAIWHGLTAGTMTLPEAVAAYKDAMKTVVDYENEFRKLGEDENSDYIQDLIKQWWGYSDEIKKIQDDLLDELKDNIENRLDEAEKVKNQQVDAIEAAAKAEKDLNRLEELRLDLLEAQNALLNAQSERTVRIYNAATGQWEWVADAGTVKSARESVEKAQKSLSEETAEQARAAQIEAIEAEYEKLTKEWDDILSSLEEPVRGIDAIAHDIYNTGTDVQKAAASRSWTLGDSIAASILAMNGMGGVSSIDGKPIMYGASGGVSGGVIVGGTSQAGAGNISYYINGVEISGDRAETMTVADLARSLSTLAIYNNT